RPNCINFFDPYTSIRVPLNGQFGDVPLSRNSSGTLRMYGVHKVCSKTIWQPSKSQITVCVSGVSRESFSASVPPVDTTLCGKVFPMHHRARSIWCTPSFAKSPPPYSQNQCQL